MHSVKRSTNTRFPASTGTIAAFRNHLLRWYDAHRRDLPWRRTSDPYRIWISEIMLQQTRVGAVLDHYRRFLEKFPTVESLARAREQSVLAAWSGLGYYRRARNLHATAKTVVREHYGEFPRTAETLQTLPGIGRYTAAAIASIAFNEPKAVVDGNVERVLSRISGDPMPKAQMWTVAEQLLSQQRPGDFNQAMMELGATVCLPREPQCEECPVKKFCTARGAIASGVKEVRRQRTINYQLAKAEEKVWLVQRPKTASLMPGMWELPDPEANGSPAKARFKHSILNTDFDVHVYCEQNPSGHKGRWIGRAQLPKTALTGLTRKILRHFEMM